ncbi:MAG: flavin reductase family protein [Chloroflexota bacterium]
MKKSIGARTIVYPTPVFVVGTYDANGRPNAMTAAWGGLCCSRPPCLCVALRAATYTYGNIVAEKCFTVSIPSSDHVREADYLGLASGRETDKFAAAGLTPVPSQVVHAPYVGEFPFVLECKLLHTIEIGLHTQFIGEILDIKADDTVFGADGRVHMDLVRPFLFAPDNREYWGIGERLGPAFEIGKALLKP